MFGLLTPDQVRYRICRLLRLENPDEAAWPMVAGIAAKRIAEEYATDFKRCQETCRMIREDEAAAEESV